MNDGTTVHLHVRELRYRARPVKGIYDVGRQVMHPLQRGRVLSIGRARHCAVQLADPAVSLVHCDIVYQGDGSYVIQDAGSTNGLYVNDLRVSRAMLVPGMWIFLGNSELVVLGSDGTLPIVATTETSFLVRAASYYGSNRSAARKIHRSEATIRRAKDRRGNS